MTRSGRFWLLLSLGIASGCTIGGVEALPPLDASGAGDDEADAGAGDGGGDDAAPACTPGEDGDGDGVPDCDEAMDGDPYTDPAIFNGLTAAIGDRPEWTGTCNYLDDLAEMESHFAAATRVMDVYAGWDFDTGADDYADPGYGFQPAWESSDSGRFSVRYAGRIHLAVDGFHCFSIDIGATGSDIISGKNACGQVWLGNAGAPLAETGYESSNTPTACAELPAGEHELAVVFWYFNVLEQAKLHVRHCSSMGGPCTPDQPLAPAELHVP